MTKEEAKEIIDKISKEEFPYALALAKAYEKLEQENQQLKDNWNKLRDYLFDIRQRGFELQNLADIHNIEPSIGILMILDKMQELEKGNNND